MQSVRPVAVIGRKAFGLDLCAQAPRVKNTQMTAGRLVILARQRPANALAPGPGHARAQAATGFEHAEDLLKRGAVIGKVFQNFATDHRVEGIGGKRQAQGIADGERQQRLGRRRIAQRLAKLALAAPGRGQILGAEIDTDGLRAVEDRGGDGVAAFTAAQIEHLEPGPQRKKAPIKGLHRGRPRERLRE